MLSCVDLVSDTSALGRLREKLDSIQKRTLCASQGDVQSEHGNGGRDGRGDDAGSNVKSLVFHGGFPLFVGLRKRQRRNPYNFFRFL